MAEIWNGNDNGINLIAHFIKHSTIILKSWSIRKLVHDSQRVSCAHIGIAQSHNGALSGFVKFFDYFGRSVAYTNTSQIYFFVGAHFSRHRVLS